MYIIKINCKIIIKEMPRECLHLHFPTIIYDIKYLYKDTHVNDYRQKVIIKTTYLHKRAKTDQLTEMSEKVEKL